MVLLTPGPCMTSDTVRAAAALPDLNHRDPAYHELFGKVRSGLVTMHPGMEDWKAHLLGGSGTAAVEAMVTSCVEKGPVLILANGFYSSRIADVLKVHGIPFTLLEKPWTEPFLHPDDVSSALSKAGYEAVLGTHHETTLGYLADLWPIAEACAAHGVKLLVDAMSSFGGDQLDASGIHAVAASANKCLRGLAGLSFVLTSPEMTSAMKSVGRRSYYLHLPMYAGDSPPLTPPVPLMQALAQALEEHPGQSQYEHGAKQKIRFLQEKLRARDFGFALEPEVSSCTMLCPSIPKGWRFDDWFEANYERGFVIYGCKGDLRERYFQVSVMGHVTYEQLQDWLAAVYEILA